jgi:hypothetical protein
VAEIDIADTVVVEVAFAPVGIGFFGADGAVFALSYDSTGGGWRPFGKVHSFSLGTGRKGAHLVEQLFFGRLQLATYHFGP